MLVKKAFMGCRDGDVHPSRIEVGSECPPELLKAAADLGALESDKERRQRLAAEREAAEKEAAEKAEADRKATEEAEKARALKASGEGA